MWRMYMCASWYLRARCLGIGDQNIRQGMRQHIGRYTWQLQRHPATYKTKHHSIYQAELAYATPHVLRGET